MLSNRVSSAEAADILEVNIDRLAIAARKYPDLGAVKIRGKWLWTAEALHDLVSAPGYHPAVKFLGIGKIPDAPLRHFKIDEITGCTCRSGKTWRDYANCLGEDSDIFFPMVGGSARRARSICADCGVRSECLKFALDYRPVLTYGVWGGMTERQLRAVRRRRMEDIASGITPGVCQCGAPEDTVPTGKYAMRHLRGLFGLDVSSPCEAALRCRRAASALQRSK